MKNKSGILNLLSKLDSLWVEIGKTNESLRRIDKDGELLHFEDDLYSTYLNWVSAIRANIKQIKG